MAFGRGQSGRSEVAQVTVNHSLILECVWSACTCWGNIRSTQSEIEKVRVAFQVADLLCLPFSVCCGVWRGVKLLAGPSCDLL